MSPRTGDIGLVAIVGEGAVASGVRRIEARTAEGARSQLVAQSRALRDMAALMRAPVEDAPARLAALLDERKRLERELADAKRKLAMGGGAGDGAAEKPRDIGGVKLLARAVEGIEAKDLKSMVDDAKKAIGSGVVAIASASPDGKAGIVVGVTDDLTEKYSAVDFVRVAQRHARRQGRRRPARSRAGGRPQRRRHRSGARLRRGRAARKSGRAMSEPDRRRGLALLRRRVHVVLDGGSHDRLARVVHRGLIGLVLLSVVSVIFESVPEYSDSYADCLRRHRICRGRRLHARIRVARLVRARTCALCRSFADGGAARLHHVRLGADRPRRLPALLSLVLLLGGSARLFDAAPAAVLQIRALFSRHPHACWR